MFNEIKENFYLLQEVVYDIEGLIETYNKDCNDKCLPGYVKCANGPEDTCILACDCCALQSNDAGDSLTCCATGNHPENEINYALGEGAELFCFDWCCEDTEVRCNNECVGVGSNLGVGNSLPPQAGDDEYDYGYEGVGVGAGPIVCCTGDDCCVDGQIWPLWINANQAFCCIPDEVLQQEEGPALCCCETEEEVCCPDLDIHCQPAENTLCCDLTTETVCHGECWPIDKPCCDDGKFNCEF